MLKHPSFADMLLVSDLDGTLLTRDFQIPPRSLSAVLRFQELGGLFTFATGRPDVTAEGYARMLKLRVPAILCNGATIYDFGRHRCLWAAHLPYFSAGIVKAVLEKMPEIGVEIFCDDGIYIVNDCPYTELHRVGPEFRCTLKPLAEVPPEWIKVVFAGAPEELRRLETFIKGIGHEGMDTMFSFAFYYEMLPAGVSKGTTLRLLAGMLGVDAHNITAIGDYYNDLSLLENAAFSAVPSQAPQELQMTADLVVGRCEDGAVADLIEHMETNMRQSV